jgi:hypothetical protein
MDFYLLVKNPNRGTATGERHSPCPGSHLAEQILWPCSPSAASRPADSTGRRSRRVHALSTRSSAVRGLWRSDDGSTASAVPRAIHHPRPGTSGGEHSEEPPEGWQRADGRTKSIRSVTAHGQGVVLARNPRQLNTRAHQYQPPRRARSSRPGLCLGPRVKECRWGRSVARTWTIQRDSPSAFPSRGARSWAKPATWAASSVISSVQPVCGEQRQHRAGWSRFR